MASHASALAWEQHHAVHVDQHDGYLSSASIMSCLSPPVCMLAVGQQAARPYEHDSGPSPATDSILAVKRLYSVPCTCLHMIPRPAVQPRDPEYQCNSVRLLPAGYGGASDYAGGGVTPMAAYGYFHHGQQQQQQQPPPQTALSFRQAEQAQQQKQRDERAVAALQDVTACLCQVWTQAALIGRLSGGIK